MIEGAKAAQAELPIWSDGWYHAAQKIESPNYDARPDGAKLELLVLHNISLPPGQFFGDDVEKFLTNQLDAAAHPYYAHIATLKVSTHFFIRRDGCLIQFVSCERRAWHAGKSSWRGRSNCNDFSIGVELEGVDTQPYELSQYQQLAALSVALRQHYSHLNAVAGHEHLALARKTDPGLYFDWPRFMRHSGFGGAALLV